MSRQKDSLEISFEIENLQSATQFTELASSTFFKGQQICDSLICKMQVVRQCSACASRAAGGLVRNQTDMSLLRSSKRACVRDLRWDMNNRHWHGTAKLWAEVPSAMTLITHIYPHIYLHSSSESASLSSTKSGVENAAHMAFASLSVPRGLCVVQVS